MKLTTLIFVLMSSLYFISCDKDVSVTPPEAPAPKGSFSINSNPPGAEIYVNNRTTGHVTPDSVSWLAAGKYDIKLTLPLYRDTLFSINISEENKAGFFVDFNANPSMYGSVICKSMPDHAEIFLNGQPTNKITPDTLKGLLPGAYNVSFKSLGCRGDSMRVIVKSGTLEQAAGKLQDTTVWLTYNKKNSGLPSNDLTCVAVDGKDVVWIGTIDRGLVSFDGGKWETYNTSNSALPSNNITSLAIHYVQMGSTYFQTIYIGTPEGLAIMVGKTFYVFNKSNSPLPDNYVTSISLDRWNYAWVGTQKGLLLVPDGQWTMMKAYDLSSTLGENFVTCVAAAAPKFGAIQHQVFIGLLSRGLGLFNYTTNSWKHYSSPTDRMPNNELRSMAVVDWNDVYFGCAASEYEPSGMAHFYSNSFGLFQLGTDKNSYTSILSRNDGSTWICTREGLFYRPAVGWYKQYDQTNSGLPSNSLSGIAFDSGGRAWITTTYNGLVVYKQYMEK